MTFQPVEAEKAIELNAAVPAYAGPILPASPFSMGQSATDASTRLSALECLTSAIYYEAASESLEGQRAVAQVVLNRVRHPAYPHTVCGVVFQGAERTTGCQFTFTCDGSLSRPRHPALWRRATTVASNALGGYVERSVGTATHYHTVWVVPYWQSSLTKIATLGAHIFYRWSGNWGQPGAFSARHAGMEILPQKLALLGVSTEDSLLAPTVPDGLTEVQESLAMPTLGPAVAKLQIPTRTPSADSAQSALLADENRGVLLR